MAVNLGSLGKPISTHPRIKEVASGKPSTTPVGSPRVPLAPISPGSVNAKPEDLTTTSSCTVQNQIDSDFKFAMQLQIKEFKVSTPQEALEEYDNQMKHYAQIEESGRRSSKRKGGDLLGASKNKTETLSVSNTSTTTGLVNLGNSCFFNAGIQFLFSSYKDQLGDESLGKVSGHKEAVIEKFKLFRDAWLTNPKDLVVCSNTLTQFHKAFVTDNQDLFRPGAQEDADEMLQRLLENLGLDFTLSTTKTVQLNPNIYEALNEAQQALTQDEITTPQTEAQYVVKLPIGCTPNIVDALTSYERTQRFDENNKFRIQAKIAGVDINQEVPVDQSSFQDSIELKSDVLSVSLKRWNVADPRNPIRDGRSFDIPAKLLFHNNNFQLESVVCHQGSVASGGHYVAYVKEGDTWYLCNDSIKTPKSQDEVLRDIKHNAYLISYRRIK